MSAALHITANKKEKWIADVTLDNVEHCKYDHEDMKIAKIIMDISGIYITYTCSYCHAIKRTAYVKTGEEYHY